MTMILLLLMTASASSGTPAQQPAARVESTLVEKVEKDAAASISRLEKPPARGCWKSSQMDLFNVVPANLDSEGLPQGPWSISPAPNNKSARFQVQLRPEGATGMVVRIKDSKSKKPLHQSSHAPASGESHLDSIEIAQDGRLILFNRSVVEGDVQRYQVSLARGGSDSVAPLSARAVAFASVSPDLRLAFLETGELVDLERWTSTLLEVLPEGLLRPVAWSCDLKQLFVAAVERPENPKWASTWLIQLPQRTATK